MRRIIEEIRTAFQAEALLGRVTDELLTLVRPAIRMRVDEKSVEAGTIPPGASKLGGLPDLPEGEKWPETTLDIPAPTPELIALAPQMHVSLPPPQNTLSLPFIAQIRLEDLIDLLPDSPLPTKGTLFFFYSDAAFASDGARDTGSRWQITSRIGDASISYNLYGAYTSQNCRVLFCPDETTTLVRQDFPPNLLSQYRYKESSVSFEEMLMLPNVETSYIGEPDDTRGLVRLTSDEWEYYSEVLADLIPNADHLLGYSQDAQPYALEGSYKNFRSELFPELPDWNGLSDAERQTEYHACSLLLQIEPHENGMHFGRAGTVYFFIRNADLIRGDFSRVWAWVQ